MILLIFAYYAFKKWMFYVLLSCFIVNDIYFTISFWRKFWHKMKLQINAVSGDHDNSLLIERNSLQLSTFEVQDANKEPLLSD